MFGGTYIVKILDCEFCPPMSMLPPNLFQEVQEDLERQKLEAFWKNYGFWIVLAAVGIVLSTATSTAYRSWKTDRNQKITAAYLTAIENSSEDTTKNLEDMQKFVDKNAGTTAAALAVLHAGAAALDREDKKMAQEYFDKIATDTKVAPALRQLGELLSVKTQLDTGDAAKLSARLQPLTADNAAWKYSASEADAYLAFRAGDKNKAKNILTSLSQDPRAPQSLSARALNLLQTLNEK